MASINIRQLAKILGLSPSTVSRATSGSYEVSDITRERVMTMAQQLNYHPNPYAGSLRNSVSRTIGLVLPEVTNHFFSLVINGIEDIAQQKGYHVLIYLTHDSYEQEIAVTKYLTSGRVDGVLLSLASETQQFDHLNQLKKLGLPLVLFDRVNHNLQTATVTADDYASGYTATQHLIEAGCRTIAYLLISPNLSVGKKRCQGYLDALRDYSLGYDATLVVDGSGSNEQNAALIKELLANRPDIDGVFASTERLALSFYQACRNLNLIIPKNVKIIAFSNMEVSSLLSPSLTTITQPAYAMGREAATILFRAIAKNKLALPSQSLELKSELFVRASTRHV